MPRPAIKLDEGRRKRLMAALEAGATLRMSAAAAGVSEDTLARWRKADADLQADIETAEARGAVRALEVIQQAAAAGTWQAAAWMLERRYPADYGRRVPPAEDTSKELETVVGWLNETNARMAKILRNATAEVPEPVEPAAPPPPLYQRAVEVARARGSDLAFG